MAAADGGSWPRVRSGSRGQRGRDVAESGVARGIGSQLEQGREPTHTGRGLWRIRVEDGGRVWRRGVLFDQHRWRGQGSWMDHLWHAP